MGKNIVNFGLELSRLNEVMRKGYETRGVPQEVCESQSEYMFSVAWLSMAVAGEYPELQLDAFKMIQYALVSVVGRLAYYGDKEPFKCERTAEHKAKEREAVVNLFSPLEHQGSYYIALYDTFWTEGNQEKEVVIVHQIRKAQMKTMAAKYYAAGYKGVAAFFNNQLVLEEGLSDINEDIELYIGRITR